MNPTTDRRITTISNVAIIIALIGSCCRFTAAQQHHQPTESELTAGDDGTSTLPEDVELLTGRDGLPTGKLGTPFHHQPTIYSPYGPGVGGGGLILQPQLVRPTFISNTLDRVILVEASRMMRLMGFRGISHFIRGMVRDQDERLEKQRQQLQHQLDHHHHPSPTSGIISDSPPSSSYRPLSTIKNYTSYAPPPSGLVSMTNRLKRSHYKAINSTNSITNNNNNRDIFNMMGFGKTMMQIGFNVGLRKYLRFMMQQAVGPAFRATAILFGDNAEAGPMGHIVFTQFTLSDPVMVTINATGLPAGKHAIHVHAYGDLREGCKSTGPHLRNILIGNVEVKEDGKLELNFHSPYLALFGPNKGILGRSIVIHEKPIEFNRFPDIRGYSITPTLNQQQVQPEEMAVGGFVACGIVTITQ